MGLLGKLFIVFLLNFLKKYQQTYGSDTYLWGTMWYFVTVVYCAILNYAYKHLTFHCSESIKNPVLQGFFLIEKYTVQ